jgi:hypothetical protein
MSPRTRSFDELSDSVFIREFHVIRSPRRPPDAVPLAEKPQVERDSALFENQDSYKGSPVKPEFEKTPLTRDHRHKKIGGMKDCKLPKPRKLTFSQKMQIARLPLEYLKTLALYIPLFMVLVAT